VKGVCMEGQHDCALDQVAANIYESRSPTYFSHYSSSQLSCFNFIIYHVRFFFPSPLRFRISRIRPSNDGAVCFPHANRKPWCTLWRAHDLRSDRLFRVHVDERCDAILSQRASHFSNPKSELRVLLQQRWSVGAF
jgi:hypothetical protein